jgi:hypothetical protein
VHTKLLDN